MFIWFLIIISPVFWSIGSRYEGAFLPVVSKTEILETETADNGVYINVSFKKTRQCQFLGISWYDQFNIRRGVEFEPDADLAPFSRPVGPQISGPWLIKGMASLKGSRAVASHRCHPFWTTYSVFYG